MAEQATIETIDEGYVSAEDEDFVPDANEMGDDQEDGGFGVEADFKVDKKAQDAELDEALHSGRIQAIWEELVRRGGDPSSAKTRTTVRRRGRPPSPGFERDGRQSPPTSVRPVRAPIRIRRKRTADELLHDLSAADGAVARKRARLGQAHSRNANQSMMRMLQQEVNGGESTGQQPSGRRANGEVSAGARAAASRALQALGQHKVAVKRTVRYGGQVMEVEQLVDAGTQAASRAEERARQLAAKAEDARKRREEAEALQQSLERERDAKETEGKGEGERGPSVRDASRALGLEGVAAALDQPKSISTIEKSSLEWDQYKHRTGIEGELEQYVKDGYVERQEFLQRVDARQYDQVLERRRAERRRQEANRPPQ